MQSADENGTAPQQRSQPTAAGPAASTPSPSTAGWPVAAIAGVGVLAGAGIVVFLMARAPEAAMGRTDASAAPPAPSTAPSTSPAPVEAASTPKWVGGVVNAGTRYREVVYELPAENDISTWARRVRPVLTVRCANGAGEVFVLTESAAAMEGDDGRHTVQVAYDGAAGHAEHWVASDDYAGLFAPDAVATARRIAQARTLRFGFTPYNGSPVVADFDVRGFDRVLDGLARSCRWKP
ncbi:MAG: hypothetical protein HYU53_02185 [Acidobacteria bacterium]|nr:hypothetical protein [Acidobacteriota bacterium]